jgi:MtN3 and saliva related transmembrane protein
MTTALAVTAATWGVAMALSPVLQIRKMVQRRSSRDVSIAYLAVLLVGFGLWVAYGAALENVAIMLPNAIAFCVGAATIGVAARYRSG